MIFPCVYQLNHPHSHVFITRYKLYLTRTSNKTQLIFILFIWSNFHSVQVWFTSKHTPFVDISKFYVFMMVLISGSFFDVLRICVCLCARVGICVCWCMWMCVCVRSGLCVFLIKAVMLRCFFIRYYHCFLLLTRQSHLPWPMIVNVCDVNLQVIFNSLFLSVKLNLLYSNIGLYIYIYINKFIDKIEPLGNLSAFIFVFYWKLRDYVALLSRQFYSELLFYFHMPFICI